MIVKFYTLSDPRTPEVIRYVGKTKQDKVNRRLSQYISAAKKAIKEKPKRNHTVNWMESLFVLGLNPLITILDEIELDDDSTDWRLLEQYWISQMKTWGFKLTNSTDGGDGNQNQVFSKESIEKRANKIRGVPRPYDVREKISKSHKGKVKSDTHVENIRKAIIKKQGRAVDQYTLDGVYVDTWSNIAEAARFYNVDRSSLGRCCKGIFKKSAGYVWKYKDEDIV